MTRASLIAIALFIAGCPKDEPAAKPDASSEPAPVVSAVVVPVPSASAAGHAIAAAAYEGKYTATPGALYIPSENKDYTGVKQAKDDGTKMVGDGTLSLAVDGTGKVTGTIDSGPAQGSLVDGTVEGDKLTGTVRVKSPNTDGLHGSLLGKVGGDGIEGTMTLADSNASVLRDVKFSASKKK